MENQSLIDFVMNQPRAKKIHDLAYSFEYNGVYCNGIVTKLPYTETLQIFPCDASLDIGIGVKGLPLTKEFKRNIN